MTQTEVVHWGIHFPCPPLHPFLLVFATLVVAFLHLWITYNNTIFAMVNALVRGSRKNAANCDKHCDVRNSGNRQDFERILYIRLSDVYLSWYLKHRMSTALYAWSIA